MEKAQHQMKKKRGQHRFTMSGITRGKVPREKKRNKLVWIAPQNQGNKRGVRGFRPGVGEKHSGCTNHLARGEKTSRGGGGAEGKKESGSTGRGSREKKGTAKFLFYAKKVKGDRKGEIERGGHRWGVSVLRKRVHHEYFSQTTLTQARKQGKPQRRAVIKNKGVSEKE